MIQRRILYAIFCGNWLNLVSVISNGMWVIVSGDECIERSRMFCSFRRYSNKSVSCSSFYFVFVFSFELWLHASYYAILFTVNSLSIWNVWIWFGSFIRYHGIQDSFLCVLWGSFLRFFLQPSQQEFIRLTLVSIRDKLSPDVADSFSRYFNCII